VPRLCAAAPLTLLLRPLCRDSAVGIRAALKQIVEAVDISLGAWRSAELKQPDFVVPSGRGVRPPVMTVPERVIARGVGEAFSPAVLNVHLERAAAQSPGAGGLAKTSTRSFATRPERVTASAGASKVQNRHGVVIPIALVK
jgi:hypothetical protein